MTPKSLTIVRETLQSYADRGMFRGFSEVGAQSGTTEFKILCTTNGQNLVAARRFSVLLAF